MGHVKEKENNSEGRRKKYLQEESLGEQEQESFTWLLSNDEMEANHKAPIVCERLDLYSNYLNRSDLGSCKKPGMALVDYTSSISSQMNP